MDIGIFREVIQKMEIPCLILEGNVVRFANSSAEDTLKRKLLGECIEEEILQSRAPFLEWRSFEVDRYRVYLGFDVSEVYRLKGELEKRKEFFATATHEIRSATNSILGYLALYVDGEIKLAHKEELAEKAYSVALKLSALVNDLLDYVRIEEGLRELKLEPLKVNTLLHAIVEDLKGYAFRKNVELNVSSVAEHLRIIGDKKAFCRVMRNVLDNAIKFTSMKEKGEKRVTVSFAEDEKGMSIRVEDTGIGIEPEKLSHLFKVFSSYSPEGTGLGLVISKKLVELMQGKISIHSAGPDQGTTVELWFRRAEK
ncbi:MAG: hypothetical protein DRG31_02245 [Deltaproteobacteria bacterium]|nr:MAG: hypothetical protein DRG31_02245 [Deltaproteobacteria bacterium]